VYCSQNSDWKNKLLTNATKPLYQVLLLDNNTDQDVSVHEADQVDFCAVKEHLLNGGSVFITSTDAQKIQLPKNRSQNSYIRATRNMGFIFRQRLRSH
jgi:hypothetical protein